MIDFSKVFAAEKELMIMCPYEPKKGAKILQFISFNREIRDAIEQLVKHRAEYHDGWIDPLYWDDFKQGIEAAVDNLAEAENKKLPLSGAYNAFARRRCCTLALKV